MTTTLSRASAQSALSADRLIRGSEWHEAVITAGVRGFGGPPHGHPSRWDWGQVAYDLGMAIQRASAKFDVRTMMTAKQLAIVDRPSHIPANAHPIKDLDGSTMYAWNDKP